MRTDVVLLAAGGGRRFGGNKLLCEFGGRPLFEHAFAAVKAAAPARAVVVTRYAEIARAAAGYGFECVMNPEPEKGQAHSLQLGLRACEGADAVLFTVCDQPYLRARTISEMLRRADEEHILRCCSGARAGSPVVFPKRFFAELLALRGDVGGRAVLRAHPEAVRGVETADARELEDADTREQLEELRGRA